MIHCFAGADIHTTKIKFYTVFNVVYFIYFKSDVSFTFFINIYLTILFLIQAHTHIPQISDKLSFLAQ